MLVDMLNESTMSYENVTGQCWITNAWATNHMTGMLDKLFNLKDISQWPVGLPNGASTVATKVRTTILYGNFILDNVLYVPGLKCNLIYIYISIS